MQLAHSRLAEARGRARAPGAVRQLRSPASRLVFSPICWLLLLPSIPYFFPPSLELSYQAWRRRRRTCCWRRRQSLLPSLQRLPVRHVLAASPLLAAGEALQLVELRPSWGWRRVAGYVAAWRLVAAAVSAAWEGRLSGAGGGAAGEGEAGGGRRAVNGNGGGNGGSRVKLM